MPQGLQGLRAWGHAGLWLQLLHLLLWDGCKLSFKCVFFMYLKKVSLIDLPSFWWLWYLGWFRLWQLCLWWCRLWHTRVFHWRPQVFTKTDFLVLSKNTWVSSQLHRCRGGCSEWCGLCRGLLGAMPRGGWLPMGYIPRTNKKKSLIGKCWEFFSQEEEEDCILTENCLGVEACDDCSISNIDNPDCGDGEDDGDGDGGGKNTKSHKAHNIFLMIIFDSDGTIIVIGGNDGGTMVIWL